MLYKYKNWEKELWLSIYLFTRSYPIKNINEVLRKKYYTFFFNLQDFIPNNKIKEQYIKLFKVYSILPYLDTKKGIMNWINFIHNKINIQNGLKPLNLNHRISEYNLLLNPDVKQKVKEFKIPINKKNILNLIILFLFIYIVFSFNI